MITNITIQVHLDHSGTLTNQEIAEAITELLEQDSPVVIDGYTETVKVTNITFD